MLARGHIKVSIVDVELDQKRDPNDCHKLPFLDDWIGKRAIIKTSKGTIKGRLEYLDGWYYSQAPFRLVDGEWQKSYYRFCFRKGQFRSIESTPTENSNGV